MSQKARIVMWCADKLDIPEILRRLHTRLCKWYRRKAASRKVVGPEFSDLMKEIAGEAISIALTVADPREDGKPNTFLNHASLQAIKVASKEFKCLDDLRQLESRTTNAPASRTHHDEHLLTLLRHQYKATLQSLTDDQKQAFVLYYLKDQKVSDIAKQMGRGEKAIRSILERGRKSARKVDAQSHLTAPNADLNGENR